MLNLVSLLAKEPEGFSLNLRGVVGIPTHGV